MTDSLRARIFGLNAARVYGIDVEEVLQRAGSDQRREASARNIGLRPIHIS